MSATVTPQPLKEFKVLDVKERYQIDEKIINEEYKIWKKTSPMIYDLIYSYSMEWPSLTVEWMKDYVIKESSISANFLAGTHTTGDSQNYLKQYSVKLPSSTVPYTSTPVDTSDFNASGNQFKLEREWEHPGEVNKVRINQDSGFIATQTNYGDILIFDSKDISTSSFKKTLKYHTKEGFGLEWNPIYSKNQLLTGSEDYKVALWDLNANVDQRVLTPTRTFETHTSIVNDVSWNKKQNFLFASVSDDQCLQVHDLRSSITGYKPIINVSSAHQEAINAVEFHPEFDSLLVTAGSDNFVNCWDLRNMSQPIRKFYGHTSSVIGLKFNGALLLSSSIDRRALVWNLNRLSEGDFDLKEYEKKKSDYFDPCLAFMHGGHTGRICEADWHPQLTDVVVSCAEDNMIEVWKPRHVEDGYDETEED